MNNLRVLGGGISAAKHADGRSPLQLSLRDSGASASGPAGLSCLPHVLEHVMTCCARRAVPPTVLALLALACGRSEQREAATTGAPDFRNPASGAMTARAPATFRARFETSKGAFVIEVHREWAPHGADRFYNLVKSGYYNDTRFFRVITGFMAQFGIHGDPQVAAVRRSSRRRPGGNQGAAMKSVCGSVSGSPNASATPG